MSAGRIVIRPTRELLTSRGLQNEGAVQKYIDAECLRLCAPKVPFKSGDLLRSGTANTKIGSGKVKYLTPYARKLYYKDANFTGAPERGNYWFERMKKAGGKKSILNGAAKISGGNAK